MEGSHGTGMVRRVWIVFGPDGIGRSGASLRDSEVVTKLSELVFLFCVFSKRTHEL